jgi:uncharacterized repeat protein (TIGR03803 family)
MKVLFVIGSLVALSFAAVANEPAVSITSLGPLTTITVGQDGSFQVLTAAYPANGEVYPTALAPGDAGFFLRHGGVVDGINLNRGGTAAMASQSVGFHYISQSLLGNQVTTVMDNSGDASGVYFQVTQVTSYNTGDSWFLVGNTVSNENATAQTVDLFAAADIYLADSDQGYGYLNTNCGQVAIGGSSTTNHTYNIFVQSQGGSLAPTFYQEADYDDIWTIIGNNSDFNNSLVSGYIDNGAGIEWKSVTLPPGGTVTVSYYWSFGNIPCATNPCSCIGSNSTMAATGFTNLHAFTGGDGAYPQAGLILSGNTLYGTTSEMGILGFGTVFSVSTNGGGFTNLYNFNGVSDGGSPSAGLILSGTTLYGTANGFPCCSQGAVFALCTNGMGFTNLYNFTGGNDGGNPQGGLILSGTTLYGTATEGGTNGGGTVFSVSTNGTGFTTLHTFNIDSDGYYPFGSLILSGSNLYGTTYMGGTNGVGTVFSVSTNGTGFTILHTFTGGSDGGYPEAGLILSGNTLYGTAVGGGANSGGTVFAVNTDGTGFANLYNFTANPGGTYGSNSDGTLPRDDLILSGNTLYGTTYGGGSWGYGTVFALTTNGTGFTTLHTFSGSDGAGPSGALILSGNTLYGTTGNGYGTVFALTVTNWTTNCLQIQCPNDMVITSCIPVQEFYTNTVTDLACSNVTVWCNPTNGSYFAPNTTNWVTCYATDCCGNSNSCSFTVTVLCTPCICTAMILVNGASGPWDVSLNTNYTYGEVVAGQPNVNLPPAMIDGSSGLIFTPGNSLTISSLTPGQYTLLAGSSGTLWCDANGVTWGAPGTGWGAPSYYITGTVYLEELVGTFAYNGVIVGSPFAIGNGPKTVTIPTGANQLLLGVSDGWYNDNGGSVEVGITGLCTNNCTNCPPVGAVLLNTGYDQNDGTVYTYGAADAFWFVTGNPTTGTTLSRAATVIAPNPAWQPAQANSQWISSYPSEVDNLNGEYDFETYFCLEPGATNVVVSVCLRADDAAGVSLNGHQFVSAVRSGSCSCFNTSPTCGTVSMALDPSWFIVPGQNVLHVAVTNIYAVAMGLNLSGTVTGSGLVLQSAPCCHPASGISGKKFFDLNANGVCDPGEPALSGWTLQLNGPGGVFTALTDVNGFYYFTNLATGTYTVTEVPQTGWTQTAPAGGSYTVNLGIAQQVNSQDFGNWHTNRPCIHIFCPSNIVTECTGSGAIVPFTVTATNLCSTNAPKLHCTPPSTTLFPVGTTTVHCTAYDNAGDYDTCSFTVTVVDTTPPAITCPSNIVVSACTNIQVFYTNTVSDTCCGTNVIVVCRPPSGNYFAPGTTTPVNCVATDCNGNSNSCTFTVTVLCTNCVPAPTNLVLWLPFDETNGTTSANLASPTNYGRRVGNPTPVRGAYVANSLSFNGTTNQYVTVPDYPAIEIGTNDFTIDAWVNRATNGPNSLPSVIVDKRDLTTGTGYSLSVSYGHLVMTLANASSYSNYVTSASLVPADGLWHFIGIRVSQSTSQVLFYIDGAVNSTLPLTPMNIANTNSLWVGGSLYGDINGGDRHWTGDLDEVEVFNRALSTNELYTIYSAGTAGKCKPCCYLKTLTISKVTSTTVEVNWGGCGTLEKSTNLLGPWIEIPSAASPYIITATGLDMFYRLECP